MNEKTVDKMEHKYTKINQVWQKFIEFIMEITLYTFDTQF